MESAAQAHGSTPENPDCPLKPLSKNAQNKLLKQQRYEANKVEKKATMKEQKKRERERKQREWQQKLELAGGEEERQKLIESRKELRKERREQMRGEKESKLERLNNAILNGQKIVIDLEFAHLMNSTQLHSPVQQIMYCYAVNGRCESPAHLLLTGCEGEMQSQLQRIPGYEKWVIDKENRPFIQAFHEQKERLVYLTADSETTLEELDSKKIYIIGGLVDRNRWKGLTWNKAKDQGIRTAKLPIGSYLKLSSSQYPGFVCSLIYNSEYICCVRVLTDNQVLEILLRYLETRDWQASFCQVIPQRKRCDTESGGDHHNLEDKVNNERDDLEKKRQCIQT